MTRAGSIRLVRRRGTVIAAERLDRLILDALADATVPLSAYDLLDRIGGPAPRYPTSIDRAFERLCANGPVERVETLSCYRLRSKPDAALFICRTCRKALAETAATERGAIRPDHSNDQAMWLRGSLSKRWVDARVAPWPSPRPSKRTQLLPSVHGERTSKLVPFPSLR